MATVPTFRTWVSGEIVTAAYFNSNVRDSGNFFVARPLAILRQTTIQSLTTATWTDTLLDAEDIDRDGGHSTVTNVARYTSPTAGYLVGVGGGSFASSATGFRGARVALNSAALNASQAFVAAGAAGIVSVPTRAQLVPVNGTTDYVTLQLFQSSGGALNTAVTTSEQSGLSILWATTL